MRADQRLLSLFLISVLLAGGAAASVSIQPQSSEATPVDPAYFKLFLTPQEETNYTVEVDGPGSTVVVPEQFTVEEDGNETVNIWFRPSKDIQPGKYSLTVEVGSSGGMVEVLKPLVKVDNDHRIEVLSHSEPTCSDRTINVTVKNTGFSPEDLNVITGGETVGSFSLKPGERREISFELSGSVFRSVSVGSYASTIREVELPDCGEEEEPLVSMFFSEPGNVALSLTALLLALVAALQYSGRIDVREYVPYEF
ncbi:MAG: hypothetical protein ABEJ36_01855 [Candidatus Nanosalina sp.]